MRKEIRYLRKKVRKETKGQAISFGTPYIEVWSNRADGVGAVLCVPYTIDLLTGNLQRVCSEVIDGDPSSTSAATEAPHVRRASRPTRCQVDLDGRPDFRQIDAKVWSAATTKKLCGVCGDALGEKCFWIGGPRSRCTLRIPCCPAARLSRAPLCACIALPSQPPFASRHCPERPLPAPPTASGHLIPLNFAM